MSADQGSLFKDEILDDSVEIVLVFHVDVMLPLGVSMQSGNSFLEKFSQAFSFSIFEKKIKNPKIVKTDSPRSLDFRAEDGGVDVVDHGVLVAVEDEGPGRDLVEVVLHDLAGLLLEDVLVRVAPVGPEPRELLLPVDLLHRRPHPLRPLRNVPQS